MLIFADSKTFNKCVNMADVVVVDFYASWCGPCQMLAEELIKLDKEGYSIVKINIDENEDLAIKFRIDAVPHIYIFKGGNVATDILGYHTAEEIKKVINRIK